MFAALRATADALVVEDRDFDPSPTRLVELRPPDRARIIQRRFLVATVVLVVLVAAAMIVRLTATSTKSIRTAQTPTTSVTAAPTTIPTAGSTPSSSRPAPAALVAHVASVPVGALDVVGAGSVARLSIGLPGPELTEGGKPRVVWIGAEYCPFCAAERWPLTVALARFGTFSDLRVTSSAAVSPQGAAEVFPDTQTFSFHGSTYTSGYLAFDSVEQTNRAYRPLDVATPEEQMLLQTFDAPPYVPAGGAGSIPFVDLANKQPISGATFSPAVLQGVSADNIAQALSDPNNDIAKAVDGTANLLTAQICTLTNEQPANVCTDPMITNIQKSTVSQLRSAATSR